MKGLLRWWRWQETAAGVFVVLALATGHYGAACGMLAGYLVGYWSKQ